MPDAQFYVGQKAFIAKDDAVLILHDPHEGVDFPGGKIQIGETNPMLSLRREVLEETGLEISVRVPFVTWTSVFPESHPTLAGQNVYLVGYRAEYVSGEVRLSLEHDWFQWVTAENYQEFDDGTGYFHILHQYFDQG